MDTDKRSCVLCTRFHMEAGDPGYSEMTPGWDPSMECLERVWEANICDLDTVEFRALIKTAETCGKYFCVNWDKKQ